MWFQLFLRYFDARACSIEVGKSCMPVLVDIRDQKQFSIRTRRVTEGPKALTTRGVDRCAHNPWRRRGTGHAPLRSGGRASEGRVFGSELRDFISRTGQQDTRLRVDQRCIRESDVTCVHASIRTVDGCRPAFHVLLKMALATRPKLSLPTRSDDALIFTHFRGLSATTTLEPLSRRLSRNPAFQRQSNPQSGFG